MKQIMWLLAIWWGVHAMAVFSQNIMPQDKWSALKSLQGQAFRDSVMIHYDRLKAINDYKTRMQWADSLFEITRRKDEIAHVHSLIFFEAANNTKTKITGISTGLM